MRPRLTRRYLQPKPGAPVTLGVDEAQGAAVQLGDPASHSEPEAGATSPVGPEAREDPLAVLGRHSPAAVDDLEPPTAAHRAGADPHLRVGRGVATGVVEDVDQQLAQPGRVRTHEQVVGHLDLERARPARRRHLGHRVGDERTEVDLLPVELDHPCLEPGELEEVVDEVGEAVGLVERGTQPISVRLDHAVGEVLQERGHGGERGPELVRHGGDEVATLTVDRGQVLGHPVEGVGEQAHLVGRRGVHPSGVVTAGHRPRHLGHPTQRGDHPCGEQLGDTERQRDADRHHEQWRDVSGGAQQGQQHRDDDRGRDQESQLDLEARDRVERRARRSRAHGCSSRA
jgi:hypothetical protein